MSDKLYTWIDVQNRFREFDPNEKELQAEVRQWLKGKSVRAYWDGLRISWINSKDTTTERVTKDLLEKLFLGRYNREENIVILGESPHTIDFKIYFEEEDDDDDIHKESFRAAFAPSAYVSDVIPFVQQRISVENEPVIVAFHSFKGGVGRTLHAITLALSLSKKGSKVLLIDSDFEAPGISWYFSNPTVAFADFLAMCHGDNSPDFSYAIENTAAQIPQNGSGENLFILPAFRDSDNFGEPIIKPEHLNTISRPFNLQDLTFELGKKLGVDYIIIDLRAGLSELSSGWLLDPKVLKVVTTTLSGQSLRGSKFLLEKTREIYESFQIDAQDTIIPFLIFSQISPDIQKAVKIAWETINETFPSVDFINLKEFYSSLFQKRPEDGPFSEWVETVCFSSEQSNLKNLQHSWDDVIKQIESTDIFDKIEPLNKWIPTPTLKILRSEGQNIVLSEEPVVNQDSQRKRLSETAGVLITADSTDADDFLITQSIEQLATRHITTLPVVVVVGAKGSGKTYLFKSLGCFTNWSEFVKKVRNQTNGNIINAKFCRVTTPENIRAEERNFNYAIIKEYIEKHLQQSNLTVSQWRLKWLDIIAWANNFKVGEEDAWGEFSKNIDDKIICLFDGLEELFHKFYENEDYKIALRALLQDVPNWLESLPNRKIGLVIFIRQDIVSYVIPQNVAQFMDKYREFQLKWNEEEALRLAYWVAEKSGVLPPKGIPKNLDREELETALYPIWGRRLGNNNSREARTANWVLSALSNLQDEVQSRDIVRFLHFAAHTSQSDPKRQFYEDRLLTPTSIRNSIEKVGAEKLDEVRQENIPLYDILQKIKDKSVELKFPCPKANLDFLKDTERDMLDKNGVLREHKNEYYLAEIYRRGLGVGYSRMGKPKLL
jgi:cellulose biosynthesis protein BcsQ